MDVIFAKSVSDVDRAALRLAFCKSGKWMFSYRHSFHAGNHADVLKHICMMLVLEKLTVKSKPAIYIDTHSGAGIYELDGEEATKTQEYLSGVSKIIEYKGDNAVIQRYQTLITDYTKHESYPGSPVIAQNLLREQDQLVLMEYHNSEILNLKSNLKSSLAGDENQASVAIHHRDGFEGLLAISPPNPARGLTLIDPPYEVFDEYLQVVSTLETAVRKWPIGTYMIWYPLLSERAGKKSGESQLMIQKLAKLNVKNCLNVQLCVEQDTSESGMYGSGVIILNAPWQLDTALSETVPELYTLLAKPDYQTVEKHGFSINWLKQEEQA